jgi:hypothetical protein
MVPDGRRSWYNEVKVKGSFLMDMLQRVAQTTYDYGTSYAGTSFGGVVLALACCVFIAGAIVGAWKAFQKAGQPGWAAIVPLYHIYIYLKISGRPDWWLLLYLVPFVGFVVHILVSLDVAKRFHKSELFGVLGLGLIPGIGLMILGYSDATYSGDDEVIGSEFAKTDG